MFQTLVALLLLLPSSQPQRPLRVVMDTDLGQIEIEIDAANAPATAANFLKYVDAGLYDGGRFHRTVRPDNQREKPVKIAVIQGAANAARRTEFLPAIPLERTSKTGLAHRDGTISMARDGPDTATDEFFICVGDQPELDFGGKRNPDGQGFAAFGRVVRGMDVVRRIQESPAKGETLQPPVTIQRVRRSNAAL
jgi:peptidyl-prolyl cis-trans isomerase A (cyclophilin A)